MLLGGITLVLVPVIERIFLMQGIHIVVAIGLRQDGSRCNAEVLPVAFHHRGMRQVLILLEAVPIYQQMLGTEIQLVDGPMHRQERRIQDIDLVNLFGSDHTDRPRQGFPFDDFTKQIALTFSGFVSIARG